MKDDKKVPQLRFPEFTDAWKQRKVGDLLVERREMVTEDNEYPLMAFIANEGVAPKGDRFDRSALVKNADSKKYKRTKYGDFIYSSNNLESGSIGLNKYGKASISPVYSIFYPTNLADSDFIGRYFLRKDFIGQMIRWRQGVVYGQWKIPEADFLNIDIYIPSKDEQEKIGQILDKVDNTITLQQRKLNSLQKLKKGLLQKMFPKKGENIPEIRFPEFSDAWKQRKFGDFAKVSMCKRIFKEETTQTGDVPFFKIGTFGGIPDAFISRYKFESYKAKYPYPKKGDILISASGSIGRIVEYSGKDEYFQDSNIIWLDHDESVLNSFLKHVYSIIKWNGIEGTTIKRLYNDNVLTTKIFTPSLEEQSKIGTFFTQLDNTITLQQRWLFYTHKQS